MPIAGLWNSSADFYFPLLYFINTTQECVANSFKNLYIYGMFA